MQFLKKNLFLLSLLALLLGGLIYVYFHFSTTMSFLLNNFGNIVAVLSLAAEVLTLFYFKNDKFYLWVQANIFSRLKRTYSKWSLLAFYTTKIKKENINDFIKKIQDGLVQEYQNEIKIQQILVNKLRISLNDELIVTFSLDKEGTAHIIRLETSKITVPSNVYDDQLLDFENFLEKVESYIRPSTKRYSLKLEFPDRNPYLGFLLKHLSDEMIKSLNVSIIVPRQRKVMLEAQKKNVIINAESFTNLATVAKDVFSYAPSLALK